MADFDPLDLLSPSLERPEQPDAAFNTRLLDELLADLEAGEPFDELSEHDLSQHDLSQQGDVTVVDLRDAPTTGVPDSMTPTRRWLRPLVAAAVVLAVVAAALVLTRDGDEGGLEIRNAPPPDGRLDLPTAQALAGAVGGPEGMVLATIPYERPTTLVTFDPLDPDRVLVGDTGGQSANLWLLADGEATPGSVPWLEEQGRFWQGGMFQRDGTVMVYEGGLNEPTGVILLDNEGQLVAEREVGGGPSYLPVSQGDTAVTLVTGAVGCPYSGVVIAGPGGPNTVDDRLRAFTRTDIPEPGVGMAFPYLGHSDACDPPVSTVALAWDIETGAPLPDYPLDGLEIARAAVSGDGTRALVMAPDGTVTLLDMDSGATLETLGTFDTGRALHSLALNGDGTIAAIVEDSGRATVWHADSATLLLEATSDPVPLQPGRENDVVPPGAGLGYHADRLAVFDEEANSWQVLTLDPNEWAEIACETGSGVSEEDLDGRGLEPGAGC